MHAIRVSLLVLTALAGAAAAGQTAPTPAALAALIQDRYAKVRDFTADFTLTQSNVLLPRGTTDKGQVRIKKPLRMRWTYTTSDKQQFVSDGAELYSYNPADRLVTVTPLPSGNNTSTALLFLAGRGDLTRDFLPSMPAEQPAGEWWLTLRPAGNRRADFTTLTLEVARGSYELRGFSFVDDQGGTSRFRFANLRENRGLRDAEFMFQIPKGVDVERTSR